MRKYAKRLHLWLALPFGVILTLVCFSGAVLAFEKEFTQWAYAGLYQVETVGKDRLPVGDIAAKVASSPPGRRKGDRHHYILRSCPYISGQLVKASSCVGVCRPLHR